MLRALVTASGRVLLASIVINVLFCVLFGAPRALAETPPWERCDLRADEPIGGTAKLLIEAADRSGEVTVSRAQLAWQTGEDASRVLLEMFEPVEINGSRVLLIAPTGESPQAWAYLPEIAQVKRVGGRHLRKPLFGTSITYADLEHAGLLSENAEVERWSEGDLDGRPVWQIESRSGKERITSWLDRERCVPLRTEVTDRKGRLARIIEVSPDAFEAGDEFVPRELKVRDLLDHTETRVTLEEYASGEVAVRFFDPARLAPITTHAAASP